ncbi:MAG: UDP-GlcNAc:undecaprenyl-phosphate GlcNAc-1-phosphate transferase [Flavobacteriales bacterium]
MDFILLSFFTALIIVIMSTPALIKVAKLKHLVDEPSESRKLHQNSVPTIGGVIIFLAFVFSVAIWFPTKSRLYYEFYAELLQAIQEYKYLMASLVVLFFIGLKDDIIGVSPVKKLIAHMVVAFILVIMADVRIVSMHGLFGMDLLPYWASILLSGFTYIVVVNAYNLIDGIDGLAAGVGIVTTLFFTTWFYLGGNVPLAVFSAAMAGALIGFLVFNFSPAKIFMGDSGSLVVGLVICVLSIRMIEFDGEYLPVRLQQVSTPVLVMAVLSYPLIDTLRVFILRSIKGNSPLLPDKNHIHHQLLKKGLSHRQTSLVVIIFSILIIFLAIMLSPLPPTYEFLILFLVVLLLVQIPYFFFNSKKVK